MDFNQVRETLGQWSDISNKLGNEATEFISEALDKAEGNRIALIDYDDDNRQEEDHIYITVTYDGGRHPEYDSNVYSTVYEIYKKDGVIYLYTEDCEEYALSRINNIEKYDVAEAINQFINR